jgi:hypothetical protein
MQQTAMRVAALIFIALGIGAPGCGKESTLTAALSETDAAAAVVSVDVSGIAGAVLACPAGQAHPLVCCEGSPGTLPTCFENSIAPFHQCPAGAYAFPDGRSCCPLDGSAACAPAPTAPSPLADAGGAAPACSLPCPPGAYSNAAIEFEPTTPACTSSDVSLSADCLFCCFDDGMGGASCMSNSCRCTGNYPCRCVPSCPACPDGWQPPAAGQFDLCCQPSVDGTTSCFSQSALVETPS